MINEIDKRKGFRDGAFLELDPIKHPQNYALRYARIEAEYHITLGHVTRCLDLGG